MTLDDFLKETGETQHAFAERVGVIQSSIARYVNRRRIPRPEIMSRIAAATAGKVSASDFYPAGAHTFPNPPLPPAVSQPDAERFACPDTHFPKPGKAFARAG